MKQLFLIISLLLIFSSPAWAVNRYCKVAGGNYSSANTWSATSSAGVDNAGVPDATMDVILDASSATTGALVIDANSVAKTFTVQATNTGTITHNAFSLTVSGNITLVSTMTYNATSASAAFATAATCAFTSGGKLIQLIRVGGASVLTLQDNLAFTATKTALVTIGSGASIACNGKTIIGNSAINRPIIEGLTLGTSASITGAAVTTFNNVDFRDIAFTSAGNLDLTNAGANSIGDCGGNSITGGGTTLTFTTPAPQTWDGTTANADVAARWTSRVPLPQDNIIFAAINAGNSTCTYNMPRMGKDISFTLSPDTTKKVSLTLGNAVTSYGSLDFTGAGALSFGGNAWTFESQARSGTNTITSAGKVFSNGAVNFNVVGTTLSLADAFNYGGNILTINNGTLVDNGNTVTGDSFNSGSGTSTRAVTKTGNWTLSKSTTGSVINFNTVGGFTWSDTAGTITLSDNGNNAKTFTGGSQAFNNVSITGGGTGAVIITGSNTFNNITVNAPKTLTLTGNTTQNVGSFTAVGSAGNLITLNSPTLTTVPPVLNKTGGGTIQCNYLSIQGVNVTPTNTWYYGNQSTDGLGLNFGGTTDKVAGSNSATANQFSGSTAYSIECWAIVRVTAGRLVDKRNATTTGITLSTSSANIVLTGDFSGGANVSSPGKAFSTTGLSHCIGVWDGSTLQVYVNNSAAATIATTGTPLNDSALNLVIGNRNNNDRGFDGTIYAVRIYRNVALSSANVTTLYNAGVKAVNPLGNATSEYLFNEGTGSTLTDSVGGVNGTITGATWANTGWKTGLLPKNRTFIID